MAIILCLETATTNCSVAIAKEGEVLALKEDNSSNYSHAEKLHVFIKEILEENGLKLTDLNAIAISKGPGSYTGLRIGVSAAKGLCFSLEIPLISVPTLASLAHQIAAEEGLIISLLDARRMEVYSAVFNKEYDQVRETKAEVLDESSYQLYLENGRVYFIGNGVDKFQKICNHQNANFEAGKLPSAREMVYLANEKYKISDMEDVAYFEPFYLKDFIAG